MQGTPQNNEMQRTKHASNGASPLISVLDGPQVSERSMTIAKLVAALAEVVGVEPPASAKAITSAEQRIGYRLPAEVAAFYLVANGTVDATPVAKGWTRLWSLREWRPVSTFGYAILYEDVADAVVCADHSLDSWWYAVSRDGTVHIVDGLRPARVVATTFAAFIAMLLADDAQLYPPAEEAVQQRNEPDEGR